MLPAFIFAGHFFYKQRITLRPLLLLGCLLLYLVLVAAALVEGMVRPLQTLSNVVSSLREGDYSFRARGAGTQDAIRRTSRRGERARRPAAKAARAFA
jgi:two-component system nitrogen regulation sensor histidine kinase NtrY